MLRKLTDNYKCCIECTNLVAAGSRPNQGFPGSSSSPPPKKKFEIKKKNTEFVDKKISNVLRDLPSSRN
jgi:hypothetical protein